MGTLLAPVTGKVKIAEGPGTASKFQEEALTMTLTARSVTPVILAVYSVCSTRGMLGVKVAVVTVDPVQATAGSEVTAAPPVPATATVKVDAVGQLTSLLKVAVMGAPTATPAAPRAGDVMV